MVTLSLPPSLPLSNRWVVTHGSGFQQMPDLIGEIKLLLPDHLRSWTDAARMCGWAADRENARIVAAAAAAAAEQGQLNGGRRARSRRRPGGGAGAGAIQAESRPRPPPLQRGLPQPKKHSLPQSGLAGMLKFLGCPKEPHVPNRTRRGANVVESLAQCVVCLVRLGVPMPVTSRVTQAWGAAGEYAGSNLEEVSIKPPSLALTGAPGAVLNAGGGAGRRAATAAPLLAGGPVPMAMPSPGPGPGDRNYDGGGGAGTEERQGKRKNNNNGRREHDGSLGANEVYAPPRREGPPPRGGHSPHHHQHEQYAPGEPRRGDRRGGEQWRNGAPGGGWDGERRGGRQQVPAWRQNLPVDALAPDYLDYFVRDRERQFYKSAGILPYR